MRQTRLLFIVESGADVRLVEGLAERFDLLVLARRIEGGVEISQDAEVPFELKVGPTKRLGFAQLVFREVWDRRLAVDAVVVQGYGAAALAANLACRVVGLPSFMLVCSPTERYYLCRRRYPAPGKPFRRAEQFGLTTLARLNAVVGANYLVLSEHLAEVVRSHGGGRPVALVPVYGVNTAIFSPAGEPKRTTRQRLGLPVDRKLVFFSSRVAPEKDAETLLTAFRMLLDDGYDLHLLHRSGGHRAFLEDARRFGVASRVTSTDAVHPHQGLADDYRAADLCVQASREEGLGFSPLEALACGVPVVATAVGGLRETIIHGETGWSYSVGDAAGLASCIRDVLSNPTEAARRAALGRDLVQVRYNRSAVFARFQEIVEGQLRKKRDGVKGQHGQLDTSDQSRPLRQKTNSL